MPNTKVQRLKNFKVSCVAILDQPSAVGAFGIYKSAKSDKQPEGLLGSALCKFVETSEEQGLLYSLILVPDRVDRHGHWVSKEDTVAACHSWGSEGCPMDFNHGEEYGGRALTKSEVAAVENLIVQPGDTRFADIKVDGEVVDPVGAWGTVVKIHDEGLKKDAREGKLNELSLYSPPGQYELVDEDLPTPGGEDNTMSDAKLDAISKQLEALPAALAKALDPPEPKIVEPKIVEPEKKEPEVLDLTDLDVLEKLEREEAVAKMQAKHHMADPAKRNIAAYKKDLSALLKKEEAPVAKSARSTGDNDGEPAPAGNSTNGAALAKSFFNKSKESK